MKLLLDFRGLREHSIRLRHAIYKMSLFQIKSSLAECQKY